MALFGSVTTAPKSRVHVLIEFKAGMMDQRENMVYPDERKGFLYVFQSYDMLMHFCWRERSAEPSEPFLDLVIFPTEVEFKKVTQNTTGRVYVLKWKTNRRKFFFWMQEPRADKDEEFCQKINDFLEHPPIPMFSPDDDDAQEQLNQLTAGLSSNIPHTIDSSQLSSLLSALGSGAQSTTNNRSNATRTTGATSSAPTVPKTTTANRSKTDPIQITTLTNVLSSLSNDIAAGNSSKPDVDLYDLVDSENLIPLLSNKDVQNKFRVYLPEGVAIPRTENELRQSIRSPQFRQIVSAFSIALQLCELGPILAHSGFPNHLCEAASQGDLIAFANALEENDSTLLDDLMDNNE